MIERRVFKQKQKQTYIQTNKQTNNQTTKQTTKQTTLTVYYIPPEDSENQRYSFHVARSCHVVFVNAFSC